MNLEERLNKSLSDILRTSGYVFEIINNNKRQSNLITGPNNQLIPPPMMEQLAQKIAGFESILDETVTKFNDAPWCIEQIVQNKKKQEELERQQKAEAERKKREEEEALAQKKKEEEERLAREKERERAEQEARERLAREREEEKTKTQQNLQNPQSQHSAHNEQNLQQQQYHNQASNTEQSSQNDLMDSAFDLDMDMDKDLDIPNPSDILSMNFKDDMKGNGSMQNDGAGMDMDMMKGTDSLLDDLNMDLLGQDFDEGLGGGGEEEFDVENFLNQFGNGD